MFLAMVLRQDDLEAGEEALDIRETALAELEVLLAEREALLAQREKLTEERATRARDQKRTRHELLQKRRAELVEVSGTAAESLRAELAASFVAIGAKTLRKRARLHDEIVATEAGQLCQRILATVTQRYDGAGHLERVGYNVIFEDAATVSAIADDASALSRILTTGTGCTFAVDVEKKSVTAQSADSGARELGRRVLRFVSKSGAEGLEQHIVTAKADIAKEIRRAGAEAFACVDLPRAAPEILDLIGRLTFRLSHSQNQWKHSIEVARLADMLAAELGSDRIAARRGGLMHDMGKAMTHDHEGSHAVLGATVARRCGEAEVVANAIGAHHGEEPIGSVTAHLVIAADVLSGGRPGARRESATQYVERIRQIHEIASRGALIERVDVMHAGREVRITVQAEAQDDALHPLAQKVARALEDEIAFPGTIRVTVIRESRVSAIAR